MEEPPMYITNEETALKSPWLLDKAVKRSVKKKESMTSKGTRLIKILVVYYNSRAMSWDICSNS